MVVVECRPEKTVLITRELSHSRVITLASLSELSIPLGL